MSKRKVTLISDFDKSPEQGELASSSPEPVGRDDSEESSHEEEEQHSEPAQQVESEEDEDDDEPDESLLIKPPPVPVKKSKHKHKHKEDRKKDKQKVRHREDKERHRGSREHREARQQRAVAEERHVERKVMSGREREKELKEKLIREQEKREKSRLERERLERLERDKNRDRKLREDRERRDIERRKRKDEERRLQQQRKEREEIRNRKERIKERERERIVRSRSRSRDRKTSDSRDVKSRLGPRESDTKSSRGSRRDEPEHHDGDNRRSKRDRVTEEMEVDDKGLSAQEMAHSPSEESDDTASDTHTDSEETSSEEESSMEEDEDKKSEGEHSDTQPDDKQNIAKSKFDDQSDVESETGSVHLDDTHGEAGYLADTPPMSPIELKPDLPPFFPALQGCRNVEEFSCLNRIEEGTYGVVYRARDKKTDEIVALKRLKMEKEKEGFPITSLREINTLLKAQHTNIVTVREIVVGSNMDKIYIVMDYVEHDLKSLMTESMKQPFLVGEVKTLLLQLLRGVQHLHDNWIIHRDLKTSNLLLSHKGVLKIGDFGLAREYGEPLKHYTPIVVTLWYRSPELLLGIKEYSTPIDMWSVGCIMAEFLVMNAIWQGKTEIDQLQKIFKDLGTPTEKIWPGLMQLPGMKKCTFTEYPYNTLRNKFGQYLTDTGFTLLNKFLTYNPSKRITAGEAVKHEFFRESPPPVDPSMFPTWPAKSEQTHKRASSPKPPSGGKAYSKLMDDVDDAIAGGFQFRAAAKGVSATGPGFSLKF